MFRTFTSLLILAAVAGPAAAGQDITVQVAGRDAKAVQADIQKAAHAVCLQAYKEASISVHELWSCERTAAQDAEYRARPALLAAARTVSVASAAPAPGAR